MVYRRGAAKCQTAGETHTTLLQCGTIADMERRTDGPGQCSWRMGVVTLGAMLAGWGGVAWGQGQSAQTAPQSDPANRHTITVKFDYDFGKNPSCAEKPTLKTCVKQFVVYDVSGKRFRLFSFPVPDGAQGLVKGITAESPMRIFLPGTHFIVVTAENAAGVESSPNAAATIAVLVKPKAVESSSPSK